MVDNKHVKDVHIYISDFDLRSRYSKGQFMLHYFGCNDSVLYKDIQHSFNY